LNGKRRKHLHLAKAQSIIKALVRLGFAARHAKGSHVFLMHPDGRTTTIPVHSREEIDRRLFRKIAADVNIEAEELMCMVDED
jgi:predicted RNA binding protein YcfA (HicA-like mRNA interferase family)